MSSPRDRDGPTRAATGRNRPPLGERAGRRASPTPSRTSPTAGCSPGTAARRRRRGLAAAGLGPAGRRARPDRPRRDPTPTRPAADPPDARARTRPPPRPRTAPARGLGSRPRARGEVEKVFAYEGDVAGAQGWALQQGWTISDGTGPEDAVLAGPGRLRAGAADEGPPPGQRAARPLRRARPGRLRHRLRLRALPGAASTRSRPPRCSAPSRPAALPRAALEAPHRRARPDPQRRTRRSTPAGCCWPPRTAPQVRRLAQDPAVHGLLLGTDDGDEFWTAAGHLAAIRPDGHRPSCSSTTPAC